MPEVFAATFDYLCPFARNAHEAITAGLREGRDWEVRFLPFSLSQAHVGEGEPPVWERAFGARGTSGVLALAWGLAVRDRWPERFLDFHRAAFAARHDRGEDINEVGVLEHAAASAGLDPAQVAEEVAGGEPLDTLAAEHTEAVDRWKVFGVPTLIQGEEAVFLRMMERGRLDDLERIIGMISWRRLNEFKRTTIPR